MSATEELRRLLDERGAKYEVDDAETVMVTRWEAYGDWVSFIEYDNGDTKFCIDARRMTPAQAIEATLGRGTLTAEQVRGVLLLHLPHREYYSIEQTDGWQAIADELNATLGSGNCSNNCTSSERTGTCHADETDTWECVCDQFGRYGKRVTIHVMECSECGHTYEHVNGGCEFCPHCGLRIEVTDG